MISLLSDIPIPGDPQDLVNQLAELPYPQRKVLLWKWALMTANGGTMPTDDEVRERAVEATTAKHEYLFWDHPPFEDGDDMDLDYCIADIEIEK